MVGKEGRREEEMRMIDQIFGMMEYWEEIDQGREEGKEEKNRSEEESIKEEGIELKRRKEGEWIRRDQRGRGMKGIGREGRGV